MRPINEEEWQRMTAGELYSPWKVGGDSRAKVHAAQKRFNEYENYIRETEKN